MWDVGDLLKMVQYAEAKMAIERRENAYIYFNWCESKNIVDLKILLFEVHFMGGEHYPDLEVHMKVDDGDYFLIHALDHFFYELKRLNL